MDLVVLPVPTSDFRVQLADDELSSIHADIQRRVEESSGMAMKEAWQRLYDRVKHMVERLSKLDDPKSRFHESTLEHVTELCRILPRLNFTDDPQLEAMRHEVEGKLAGLSKDAVVNDPVFRQTKIDEAADIMARMGAFMGGV
jgi:chromosome condensin MukBEF ATPase and DNA-binding subunit MukB